MKAATVIYQQIFSILALVIFLFTLQLQITSQKVLFKILLKKCFKIVFFALASGSLP